MATFPFDVQWYDNDAIFLEKTEFRLAPFSRCQCLLDQNTLFACAIRARRMASRGLGQ